MKNTIKKEAVIVINSVLNCKKTRLSAKSRENLIILKEKIKNSENKFELIDWLSRIAFFLGDKIDIDIDL